jgi:alkanesulfonate monooxygenase SsuD/methylene tetrahydromethanopterin reductase-like flavin-dependent oxidoreductase (luciferase family)
MFGADSGSNQGICRVGRGAFMDGFALFGYDLKDNDALFAEKLGLLMALNTSEQVTWSGHFRPALHDVVVMPRPFQERLPLWVGALSPQSVARALAWPTTHNTSPWRQPAGLRTDGRERYRAARDESGSDGAAGP